jgi:large subunit ribosomal protein L3
MEKIRAVKKNMTQIFAESGEVFAVTLVKLEKTEEAANVAEGQNVTVSGTSKGKGFQGVVKRHGFHGGPRSHGQKHSEREPGSISGSGGRAGGRVAKNMRMAGRMGGERTTVKNLRVVKVLPETGEVFISGAVPGRRGAKVEIKAQ